LSRRFLLENQLTKNNFEADVCNYTAIIYYEFCMEATIHTERSMGDKSEFLHTMKANVA